MPRKKPTEKPATTPQTTAERQHLSDLDIHLFREGNHYRLYEKLGAHRIVLDGKEGVFFAVWAPGAESVSVLADFNGWTPGSNPLHPRWDGSGIWEGFIAGVTVGTHYKYFVKARHGSYGVEKGDPFALHWETPPKTASVVWELEYQWSDSQWMQSRHAVNALDKPYSVYEVHLGSWRRVPEDGNRSLTYRELAPQLSAYVKETGFTHVEFLPIMEHPFYGSWGYQSVGYFAPTSRYGTPQDFMFLVDTLHQQGIGVILDWVPSHFPSDQHGLVYFDGSHLYEHMDPRKGFHPDWGSYIYNYGRHEVRAFLLSSAHFWFEKYHIDGIRVDAVASMLYLDYSRKHGEWIPNQYGGRENLDAISFLKKLNESIYTDFPDVQMIAEESTAWPMVSRPVYVGGLGFGLKWNMGWMHDTLKYFSTDPVFRKYHQDQLTFSIWYAFTENFMLSISHDEVVHGKGALLGKMPGDEWQRHANLRLFLGYMYMHPGKKLLFMGAEFGQVKEWNHDESLEWHVLDFPFHAGVHRWMKDVNQFYRSQPALYEKDFDPNGFEWVDFHDWENSVVSFLRFGHDQSRPLLVVCNMTPVLRHNYRVGVPIGGYWKELLNSDSSLYAGSGQGNFGGAEASPLPAHGRYYSLSLTLPPLGIVVFSPSQEDA